MFHRISVRRFWCLLLSLLLTFEPLILAAEQASGEPQEEEFAVDKALSPGDYLKNIKELRGENREEIEKRSWADWATLMANVYLLMDPNAIDAPSFENALGETLTDIESVSGFGAALPGRVEKVANILTWGSTHFGKVSPRLAGFSTKLLSGWGHVATKVMPKLDKFTGFCEFMHAPGNAGEAEAFQQWLKRKPPTTEGLAPLSKAQGAAMVVGTVIQILQGIAEIKSFFDAKSNDPGAASFATVSHAITGTVLIACAIMALIPPPGVWMVVAAVVSVIWDTLKSVFDKVGEKIAKWHKAYEDSLTFLKETDREFSAFLSANDEASVLRTGQEKSAALNLADKMKRALDENPGEGEVEERQ
ncbi:MAG TPA: hypothetical protein PKO06_18655, partial [Candidatus Ozemobacteraceae bacterium]|nr:hypothetical protein [Candidatus Ozemobacteraceae bacterium]